MKKLGLVLTVLILTSIITTITPVRATKDFELIESYWGVDGEIEVSPGDVATLTVVLRYEHSDSLKSIEAHLFPPEGFEAVGGGNNVTAYHTGTVTEECMVKLGFPVFISTGVEMGVYKATIELFYDSPYSGPQDEVHVPLEVTGKPRISVEMLGTGVHEGRQRKTLLVYNEGDAAASNIEVKDIQSNTASIELEGDSALGDLDPDENTSIPVSLFVPTGTAGQISSLNIELGYLGPNKVPYTVSESILLPVKTYASKPALTLHLNSSELSIGKNNRVLLEITNVGVETITDIHLTLSTGNVLTVFNQTSAFVEGLETGHVRQMEVEIYVPATTIAPTASLTVTASYFYGEKWLSEVESYEINLLLRGLIQISLTDYAVIPENPSSGSPFSITITVTNIGTSPAYAAYAIPSIDALPLKTFGQRSTYIGNIETNTPTSLTINLQVGEANASKITLPVTLSYMDNLRSLDEVAFEIPINIAPSGAADNQPPPQGRPFTGLLLLVIVAVISVSAVAIWMKRRGSKAQ